LKNLSRNILISALGGVVIYTGLTIWGNIIQVAGAFTSFRWAWLPGILALVSLNYYLRYLKWHYYLGYLGIRIGKAESAHIFLSGLSLSVTPYKAGEVIKSHLLKQVCREDMCRTAPIVLAERLTDLIGVIILAAAGAMSYRYGGAVIGVALAAVIAFFVFSQSPKASLTTIGILGRLPLLRRYRNNLITLYESSRELLRLRPTVMATAISTVSWFFECLAAWMIVVAFGADMSLLQATFVYAFSSIAGAIVLLPGGLGVAEVSMAGLLVIFGMPHAIAAGATLLVRVCTLWFAVAIGVVAISLFMRKQSRLTRPAVAPQAIRSE